MSDDRGWEIRATFQDGTVWTGWKALLVGLPYIPVILVYLLVAVIQLVGNWIVDRLDNIHAAV